MKQVQAAAHCVTQAAENNGPMIFAEMSMMPGDQPAWRERNHLEQDDAWGKRKLKRDQ
jgi:hypothetical protein